MLDFSFMPQIYITMALLDLPHWDSFQYNCEKWCGETTRTLPLNRFRFYLTNSGLKTKLNVSNPVPPSLIIVTIGCLSQVQDDTNVLEFYASRHFWWPLWLLITPDMAFVWIHVVPQRQVCVCLLRQGIFVEPENFGTYGPTSSGGLHSHFLLIPVCTPALWEVRAPISRYPKPLLLVLVEKPSSFSHSLQQSFPYPPRFSLLSISLV